MLSDIEVRDFRCFTSAHLALHPQTTVLVGRNAQGKTSLLEAACVLMRLQSPRTSVRTDLIRVGATSLMVEGRWRGQQMRCGMSASARRLAVDGATCYKAGEYLQQGGLVVWMDHADMNLVRGTGEHRRRFLDFAASQISPGYLKALQGYTRALRSRNYVLKRDAVIQWKQADAYAILMQDFHALLTASRRQLVAMLQPHAAAVMDKLSGGHEPLSILYEPGCEQGELVDTLLANRAEEERTRSTFTGSHRDEVALQLQGCAADVFASEGQQRSITLALKIAQALALEQARGTPPLLLIDDVFGELDPDRRRVLLGSFPAGSQRIITTTHLEWAGTLGAEMAVWVVDRAQLAQKS
jgi:DNA replication and repair protein RecF